MTLVELTLGSPNPAIPLSAIVDPRSLQVLAFSSKAVEDLQHIKAFTSLRRLHLICNNAVCLPTGALDTLTALRKLFSGTPTSRQSSNNGFPSLVHSIS
jgi:hypothetical protein